MFVIHTFIETRDTEHYRVFHTMGSDEAWVPKRMRYGQFRDASADCPINHNTEPQPSVQDTILRFACWPDHFIVFADTDALDNDGLVIPNAVWYALPSRDSACWMPLESDNVAIVNFDEVPADHRDTERHTIGGSINCCSKSDIMADIRATYQIPEFLLDYHQEGQDYRVDIHVPKADTVHYNLLRYQHLRGRLNPAVQPTHLAHSRLASRQPARG